jgi:nucleoside-diphosphate-sugar epimerase
MRVLVTGGTGFIGDLSLFADPGLELPRFDVVLHLAGVVAADRLGQYEAINFAAVRVAGEPQRLSFVDVRDLVDAIVLMADDRRPGSYCYFASHPDRIDVRELWRELARAVGRRVFVFPVPRALLYVAMLASTLGAALFRYKNQLDAKQYAQMVAPAFLCSSERVRADLGWSPQHGLADCLANAAEGYRAAGVLRAKAGRDSPVSRQTHQSGIGGAPSDR